MFPKEVAGLVYVDPTDFMQTEAEMQSVFAKAGIANGHAAMELMTKQLLAGAPSGLAAEYQEIERAARDGFAEFRDTGEPPDVPMTVFLSGRPIRFRRHSRSRVTSIGTLRPPSISGSIISRVLSVGRRTRTSC
jgi:hypothetical protein